MADLSIVDPFVCDVLHTTASCRDSIGCDEAREALVSSGCSFGMCAWNTTTSSSQYREQYASMDLSNTVAVSIIIWQQ